MSRKLRQLTGPTNRRIENMIARGILTAVKSGKKMQRIQTRLLSGEVKQNLEHFEQFGFTSAPQQGAETITLFLDGDRSHGLTICVGDRRYRMKGLEGGEVAMYDDKGQYVYLTKDGIVIQGTDKPITLKSTEKVRLETPRLECTGDVIDNCDEAGMTMQEMREDYNVHIHTPGGNPPDPLMEPDE